ncbi:hypothetical protein K504DRAFT_467210 [Pleomassaria siparia CBS 279.74]|uniref:Uncharacterized protein n=1 Tax=Pleomassaria siparia CBS 279.74 TaxID=1314801 RepID=A0A6G1K8M3_9PLEO|nr:hypothetical protein K504DRAFT_467210 [Pleomassaria siparia CBS 279.74]
MSECNSPKPTRNSTSSSPWRVLRPSSPSPPTCTTNSSPPASPPLSSRHGSDSDAFSFNDDDVGQLFEPGDRPPLSYPAGPSTGREDMESIEKEDGKKDFKDHIGKDAFTNRHRVTETPEVPLSKPHIAQDIPLEAGSRQAKSWTQRQVPAPYVTHPFFQSRPIEDDLSFPPQFQVKIVEGTSPSTSSSEEDFSDNSEVSPEVTAMRQRISLRLKEVERRRREEADTSDLGSTLNVDGSAELVREEWPARPGFRNRAGNNESERSRGSSGSRSSMVSLGHPPSMSADSGVSRSESLVGNDSELPQEVEVETEPEAESTGQEPPRTSAPLSTAHMCRRSVPTPKLIGSSSLSKLLSLSDLASDLMQPENVQEPLKLRHADSPLTGCVGFIQGTRSRRDSASTVSICSVVSGSTVSLSELAEAVGNLDSGDPEQIARSSPEDWSEDVILPTLDSLGQILSVSQGQLPECLARWSKVHGVDLEKLAITPAEDIQSSLEDGLENSNLRVSPSERHALLREGLSLVKNIEQEIQDLNGLTLASGRNRESRQHKVAEDQVRKLAAAEPEHIETCDLILVSLLVLFWVFFLVWCHLEALEPTYVPMY